MAREIFDTLDTDSSGSLDASKLALLLRQYGLPLGEADRVLGTVNCNASGQIEFDEWLRSMRPLWMHAYAALVEARRMEAVSRQNASLRLKA
jgi:Ca2+-binding EF-hand superfamily protein